MNKFLVFVLGLTFMACASKEEAPLRDTARTGTTTPTSISQYSGQDLHQSAKFARLAKNIRFENGGTQLSTDTKAALDEIAKEMNQATNSYQLVRISGFTDAKGAPMKNQEVSLQRAEAVRSYLINRGVPSEKLEAVGMGSFNSNSEKNLSKNDLTQDRRVELDIVQ